MCMKNMLLIIGGMILLLGSVVQGQAPPDIMLPTFTGEARPWDVSTGDLDGDGKSDLIMSNQKTAGSVAIYHNTGTTLEHIMYLANDLPWTPNRTQIHDLDGDGRADVIFTIEYGVVIYPNTSVPGHISFGPYLVCARVGYTTYHHVEVGDLDADGKPDLVASINTSTPGNISFKAPPAYVQFANPYGIAVGDLDGDGRADVAVTGELIAGDSRNVFMLSTSTVADLSLSSPFTIDNNTSAAIRIEDLDGDGKRDIVVGSFPGLRVYLNASASGNPSFPVSAFVNTGDDPILSLPADSMCIIFKITVRRGIWICAIRNCFTWQIPIQLR
jgi:hypothetical protein